MKKAVYAGSFDPISNGHLDIIQRASKLADELHIVVSLNTNKKYLIPASTRVEMIKKVVSNLANVKVVSYDGLVVNYVKQIQGNILIRSLRNYQDYEQEFSLFQYNKDIDSNIETVLLLPSSKNMFISSSAIKELLHFNCSIDKYVPACIVDEILKIYKKNI